jgi:amidophosphoribosyltransferase
MGIDMARGEDLIGYAKSVEEIRQHIGADSLAYLSHQGMLRAVTAGLHGPHGHCSACFTGSYPIRLEDWWTSKEKLAFEGIWG